jgi:hypothetical protein
VIRLKHFAADDTPINVCHHQRLIVNWTRHLVLTPSAVNWTRHLVLTPSALTPSAENEAFVLQIAEYGTANHLEYLVRKYQRCKRLQDPLEDDHWRQHKELAWHQDETGMYSITSRQKSNEIKTTR